MSEPEIGLAFTPDPWVEALHRHCSDHGGARVRSLIVESEVALEESYDVLVVGHRWPALTLAFVDALHARGCPVLGVYDREEPAGRAHLRSLGVDAVIEADAGEGAIVRAVSVLVGARTRRAPDPVPVETGSAGSGALIAVGGGGGTGRTEIALALAVALARRAATVLVDADDTGPALAIRLGVEPTPNLCDAVDAVEHGRGDLPASLRTIGRGGPEVLVGLGRADAWSQVRPGEVCRVVARLAADAGYVVADGAGPLDDLHTGLGRSRYATARALVIEATACVGVFEPAPTGIARILEWVAQVRGLAPEVPVLLAANRAPGDRFRRREVVAALTDVIPGAPVVFLPTDPRVAEAAWAGIPVTGGPFARSVAVLADEVAAACPAVEVAA